MNYRCLGATGLTVSEIGFGTWGIGGTAGGSVAYGATDDAQSRRALRRALDLGITFYDTSDFYGFGHSEDLLGEIFSAVRDRVVIATKGGLLDAAGTVDVSPGHLRRALEGSLRRLRTDYVDLYQLHSPSLDAVHDDTIAALEAFVAEGKARAFGISVRAPDDGIAAVQQHGFKSVQVNFNLADQRVVENGFFGLCERQDVGVIVRTPLCFGFLTGQYAPEGAFEAHDHRARWSVEQREKWARAGEMLPAAVGAGTQATPAQTALRFCLSYPCVSTAIPGMLTEEQVEENVRASAMGRLSGAERNACEQLYRRHTFFVSR